MAHIHTDTHTRVLTHVKVKSEGAGETDEEEKSYFYMEIYFCLDDIEPMWSGEKKSASSWIDKKVVDEEEEEEEATAAAAAAEEQEEELDEEYNYLSGSTFSPHCTVLPFVFTCVPMSSGGLIITVTHP